MFLSKSLRQLALFWILTANSVCFGVTRWISLSEGDGRCAMTCGRAGMDNVISNKKTASGESICAGTSANPEQILPGLQIVNSGFHCRIASTDAAPVKANYCLCASDGVNKGADLKWTQAVAAGRCDTTCKKHGQQRYGYAVYGAYIDQSWTHVCAAKDGTVGFTGGGQKGCKTSTGVNDDFQCLCTNSFAGDLDSRFNP